MIEDAIRSLNEPNTIIYIDSAISYYGKIGNGSKKVIIEGYLDTTKVTLHLQKNEIRFLDKEFNKNAHFAWTANMFNNSILTPLDSAYYYRRKLMKEQTNKKEKRYFHFSRVTYFRNNSLAVFRVAEMYGYSAGNDYLFFYQRAGNVWKRYMKVDKGAW